jgi:DNA-binding cell septation regulator SpoVG
MHIKIEHFAGAKPQFNVAVSSAEGREPFLTVKGCRIVDGSKGPFISWPATKNESSGKYWNHVWASEAFAASVMAEVLKSAPPKEPPKRSAPAQAKNEWPDDDRF